MRDIREKEGGKGGRGVEGRGHRVILHHRRGGEKEGRKEIEEGEKERSWESLNRREGGKYEKGGKRERRTRKG